MYTLDTNMYAQCTNMPPLGVNKIQSFTFFKGYHSNVFFPWECIVCRYKTSLTSLSTNQLKRLKLTNEKTPPRQNCDIDNVTLCLLSLKLNMLWRTWSSGFDKRSLRSFKISVEVQTKYLDILFSPTLWCWKYNLNKKYICINKTIHLIRKMEAFFPISLRRGCVCVCVHAPTAAITSEPAFSTAEPCYWKSPSLHLSLDGEWG